MLAEGAFSSFSTPPPPSKPSRLYRRFFTREECRLLDSTDVSDDSSEIHLVRILLSRALAAAQHVRRLSLKTRADMLLAFNGAAMILASLARFHARFCIAAEDPLAALDGLDPYDL
jgi:hypothetical protein